MVEEEEKEAFGVTRASLIAAGFLPREEETVGQALYIPIKNWGELFRLVKFVTREGTYRRRFGEEGAEYDPSFQHVIIYAFIRKGDKFFIYERAQDEQYGEERLRGKVSLGIGGHMEARDASMRKSFYREFAEEVEILENGAPVSLGGNPLKVREYLSITPLALIKDERDEVGRVHLGIACEIKPRKPGIEIKVTGRGENIRSWYITAQEYQELSASGEITPEGWTDIVFRNEILPRLEQKT